MRAIFTFVELPFMSLTTSDTDLLDNSIFNRSFPSISLNPSIRCKQSRRYHVRHLGETDSALATLFFCPPQASEDSTTLDVMIPFAV